ncbi:MAG: thioester domain-containing protein [Bacilli bacterium]|nr:thioester domain-containing protein [Bacilli bacterium]
MKNMKKISSLFCVLLLTVMFAFAGFNSVNAAPKTATINSKGVMGSLIGNSYEWNKFKIDDKVAYCVDLGKNWSPDGTPVTLLKEADAGVRYILENGYPYKSPYSGNADASRYITQAAIWWYLADTGQTVKLSDDFTTNSEDTYNVRPIIKQLVAGAKSAKAYSDPTLNVNVSENDMTLSSDKKYYVSKEVNVALTGASTYKVTVSGAEGIVVANTNGEAKSEFSSNEKFIVKVPASSISKTTNLTVNVSASGSVNKAYIYSPGDASYQKVAALYTDQVELEKTVTLTAKSVTPVTPGKPSVCVEYVIVGNVIPDPALTDPTPGKNCYDKGTKYTQESVLTTRQKTCKFKGWYTKESLTGKWTDGTKLDKDLILYGAWDCEKGTTIQVPATAANTPFMILAVGSVIIVAGIGVYAYRSKKLSAKK